MKLVLLSVVIALAVAVSSASVISDPMVKYNEGDRYFYFPGDGDNALHLVDTEAPVNKELLSMRLTRSSQDKNIYLLYTRANPKTPQYIVKGDANSVKNSNFNSNKITIFVAHGWNGNGYNDMNEALTEAFLLDDDVNVICVDWSAFSYMDYISSKFAVYDVGRGLGELVIWMNTLGLSYDNVHLVGFSLGGHVVGNAGRATGGKVLRITAMDPAGPLWSNDVNRLVPSDGQYVEVIHTNAGFYGLDVPCGDADFYPNGGNGQPGCWWNVCSHGRAWELMASSVKYNHLIANECSSYSEAIRSDCSGSSHPMGGSDLNKNRSGVFRLNTLNKYPF